MIKNKVNGSNANGGNHKVGNVQVKVGNDEGFYVGSASNMSRLLIFMTILLMGVIGVICYSFGEKVGELKYVDNSYDVRLKKLESKVLALEVAKQWCIKRD